MDLSIVIPSHNGAERLPATLAHVAAQRPAGLEWEVVLIDNGSDDATASVARDSWPGAAQVPLRVVREPRLGLGHAHTRGFAEARGRLVSWVEDDNWIGPDWVQRVRRLMEDHPEVGACGGLHEAACETDPPEWFGRFEWAYAVGPQGPAAGDVTTTRGFLWGAGMTVRKEAWDGLVRHGFRLLLPDRRGNMSTTSGGDGEICFALRLAGWRLWFEPELRLRHFIHAGRLRWSYLRALSRGFGASTVGFDRFNRPFEGRRAPAHGAIWAREAGLLLTQLARQRGTLLRARRGPGEGEEAILDVEWKLGRLGELLRRRWAYDRGIRAVERAAWRR